MSWSYAADVISSATGNIIGGIMAGSISVGLLVWKTRNQYRIRRMDAHTRLLRILEKANKTATRAGIQRSHYTHMFTVAEHERLAVCMIDPLISDVVHKTYEASVVVHTQPREQNPPIYLAKYAKLQVATKEEHNKLARSQLRRMLVCKGNPEL